MQIITWSKTLTRSTLIILCLVVGVSCTIKHERAVTVNKGPTRLFAIADDASYPHMSAYGTSRVKTPAFDRVAKEGLLFMNAYTPNRSGAEARIDFASINLQLESIDVR